MIPSPIIKVLSSIRKRGVRALLMGGQACIVYGAAEFSRDVDLAVLADDRNLTLLERALVDLRAEPVYFPPLRREYLLRGHACHFRTKTAGAPDLRIDVMAVLHGCDSFSQMWRRRWRLRVSGAGILNVMALPDLVRAKKTQRDKDWPMIRRLIEADYHRRRARRTADQIEFWLLEARTAELLIELCQRYPKKAARLAGKRALLRLAQGNDGDALDRALHEEEQRYRAADREYWKPLRDELFAMRQQRGA